MNYLTAKKLNSERHETSLAVTLQFFIHLKIYNLDSNLVWSIQLIIKFVICRGEIKVYRICHTKSEFDLF